MRHHYAPTKYGFMLAIILSVIFANQARAEYSFIKIATNDQFAGQDIEINYSDSFDFNNNGTVLFSTYTGGSVSTYTSVGGTPTLVHGSLYSDGTYFYQRGNSINDAGVIAYVTTTNSGVSGVYTTAGATIFEVDLNDFSYVDPHTDINGSGEVVFREYKPSANEIYLKKGEGGALTTLATGTVAGVEPIVPNSFGINNAGDVIFIGQTPSNEHGLFLGNGGPITTLSPSSADFSQYPDRPVLTNSGDVALTLGGFITTITPGFAPIVSAEGTYALSMNDTGDIAWARYQSGYEIALGLDSPERIIGSGDALDGSFMSAITNLKINNAGQIAFAATLQDGRYGIFVATPFAVPEPRTVVFSGILITFAAAGRLARIRLCRSRHC